MENFIGNNAKFIVEWGQLASFLLIIISILLLYRLGKNNRYFLPKGFLGIAAAAILVAFMLVSGLVFAKVTAIKPRMSVVIDGLESLQNKPAPPLAFTLLDDGTRKHLSDYKDKVVLLNYWATWCPPCIKEMPELNRLQAKYDDQGLVVIALSDENRDRLLKFSAKNPFTVSAAYSKEFDWAGIESERPITFLINREGNIVEYFTGGYDYDFFEAKVVRLLGVVRQGE